MYAKRILKKKTKGEFLVLIDAVGLRRDNSFIVTLALIVGFVDCFLLLRCVLFSRCGLAIIQELMMILCCLHVCVNECKEPAILCYIVRL